MKPIREMTQGELAAYIDTHMNHKGIAVVLSGGACVAIYSDNAYVSKDLDFIAQFSIDFDEINMVMAELGFKRKGKHYFHPGTDFFIDFIPGPPSIGDQYIDEIIEITMDTGVLRMISATDCVKDRLASYYFWGDKQTFEQAKLVARKNPIDMNSVEKWSKNEGKLSEFLKFKRELEDM